MSNIRDAELSQMLSGVLGRLSPPRGIANSEKAMTEEMAALFKALSACAPNQGYRQWFTDFADALASRAKTRAWPIVSEIQAAAKAVADQSRGGDTSVGADFYEVKAIDRMEEWFRKFGDQMPGHGKSSRTEALIRRGVLKNIRDARFRGFDLTIEQSASARDMPESAEEAAHHAEVMARLTEITERNAQYADEFAANRAKMGSAA